MWKAYIGECAGRILSRERFVSGALTIFPYPEVNTGTVAIARPCQATRGRRPLAPAEYPRVEHGRSNTGLGFQGPCGHNLSAAAMNDDGKSNGPIVPTKIANQGRLPGCSAERPEGRGTAKGNQGEQTRFWTQSQIDLQHVPDRIRAATRKDKKSHNLILISD